MTMIFPSDSYYRERRESTALPKSASTVTRIESFAPSNTSSSRLSRMQTNVCTIRDKYDVIVGNVVTMSRKFSAAAFPHTASTPDRATVVMSLLFLGSYIIFCGLAARFPSEMMYVAFLALGATLFAGLLVRALSDCLDSGDIPYNRNTGNTILTVLLTFAVITPLFAKQWYPALNAWVLQLTSETIPQAQFPAVAIFQDNSHEFAANLVSQPWTCWIGNGKDSNAPACDSLSTRDVAQLDSGTCNCSSYYRQTINTTGDGFSQKKIITFQPSLNIVTSVASTFLNLEVAFDYNASTYQSAYVGSPGLWISLYDPSLSSEQALNADMASIMPIDASGETTVMLNLNYYDIRAQSPHYLYNPATSTSPSRDLPCDISNRTADYTPCITKVRMRFVGLQKTIYLEHPRMAWSDVAGDAGSYFALVQFLSWVFSGLAWT